eukprot:g563.t1
MPRVERSLFLIKPDGYQDNGKILKILVLQGFFVCQSKEVNLTSEDVDFLYGKDKNKRHYKSLVNYLTNTGPSIVNVVAKVSACELLKDLVGPTSVITAKRKKPHSIRAKFGTTEMKNCCHCSNRERANAEINHFFLSDFQQKRVKGKLAVAKSTVVKDYLQQHLLPTVNLALEKVVHTQPNEPLKFLAQWILQYGELINDSVLSGGDQNSNSSQEPINLKNYVFEPQGIPDPHLSAIYFQRPLKMIANLRSYQNSYWLYGCALFKRSQHLTSLIEWINEQREKAKESGQLKKPKSKLIYLLVTLPRTMAVVSDKVYKLRRSGRSKNVFDRFLIPENVFDCTGQELEDIETKVTTVLEKTLQASATDSSLGKIEVSQVDPDTGKEISSKVKIRDPKTFKSWFNLSGGEAFNKNIRYTRIPMYSQLSMTGIQLIFDSIQDLNKTSIGPASGSAVVCMCENGHSQSILLMICVALKYNVGDDNGKAYLAKASQQVNSGFLRKEYIFQTESDEINERVQKIIQLIPNGKVLECALNSTII